MFESDPDVVSNAADGRMGQIRTFQTGRHSEWSQRLLNEVASARVCLLNESKKAAYDEILRQQLGSQAAPPVATPRGTTPPLVRPEITSRPSHVPRVVPSASRSGPRNRQLPILAAAVAAAVVVVIALAVLLLQSGGGSDVNTPPDIEPGTDAAIQDNAVLDDMATQPEEISPDDRAPPEDEERVGDGESGHTMDVPPDTGGSKPAVADAEGMEEDVAGDDETGQPKEPLPDNEMTGRAAPDSPRSEPKPPTEPDRRGLADLAKPPSRSVPAESSREDARRRIREIYQDDFDSLDTAADKVALAAKLRRQGVDTDDDPVARFVFLKMASDLAANAADPLEAFKAIDALKEHYDADVVEMKADVLTGVVKVIRGGETGAHLAQAAALLAEEAVARDDYELADRLLNLGGLAARKANNKIIAAELTARVRAVSRTARAYAPVEKALAVLANDPLDAEANDEVGRWYCFEKNDWPIGLAYLAKGKNTAVADLAERDLAAMDGTISPDRQQQLGDGWWDVSGSVRGAAKAPYVCRAAFWYQKALAEISGLEKAAIVKRLETAARDNNVVKSPTWGAVEEGNVALATNGTTVQGVKSNGNRLLDGEAMGRNNPQGKCPCQWVITFAEPYRLKEIRLRLWDREPRFFRYIIGTSSDGSEFVTLADRSQGNWSSWQQLRFSSRLVKSVKIFGLYGSVDADFVAGEFEAYCIPPETPPKTPPRASAQ